MDEEAKEQNEEKKFRIGNFNFLINSHFNFLYHSLYHLPQEMSQIESNRLLFAFFAINGIDLLNRLSSINLQARQDLIEWIYSLQVTSKDHEVGKCGFKGSISIPKGCSTEMGQITMTFCAILSLIILGDDLSRVDRKGIIKGLHKLQLKDGSFMDMPEGEHDLRMVYSVACICYIFQDWSVFDFAKVEKLIQDSLTYEGGFGKRPGCEAHGGYTYCALGTLYLMNRLNILSQNKLSSIRRWCLMKQNDSSYNYGGFCGRSNKEPDSCYSFWIGASLKIINSLSLASISNLSFLSTCEDKNGGFGKTMDSFPDLLHTFFSICGLSLLPIAQNLILPFHPALILSEKAMKNLHNIQKSWKN